MPNNRGEFFCVVRPCGRVENYRPLQAVPSLIPNETVYFGIWDVQTIRSSDGGPSMPIMNVDAMPVSNLQMLTVSDAENRIAGNVKLPDYDPKFQPEYAPRWPDALL